MSPTETIRRYLDAISGGNPNPIDWSSAPDTYKRYPLAGRVVLPWASQADQPISSTLMRGLFGPRAWWSHAVTAEGLPGGEPSEVVVNRPVPSGGALYPIEAYLATDLALYHYDAAHHSLDLIRTGDHRAVLTRLLNTAKDEAPDLVLVLSAVFWRTGFKYGDFAYRLHCQETGALIAQSHVLAEALGLAAHTHLDFGDDRVQGLLGIDPAAEGTLAIITFRTPSVRPPPADSPGFDALIARPAVQPINPALAVVEALPHLLALHGACASARPASSQPPATIPAGGPPIYLPPARSIRLVEAIATRTSAPTGYRPTSLDLPTLATVLHYATVEHVTPYLLVQRVDGLAPGVHRYQPHDHALIPVGDRAAVSALAQGPLRPNTRATLPDAAAALIPIGDPFAGAPWAGERWYRIQQIHTGLMIHRATLAATAQGLATRIHSDGANDTTDAALGLASTTMRSLSFLLIGHPRPGTRRSCTQVPALPPCS